MNRIINWVIKFFICACSDRPPEDYIIISIWRIKYYGITRNRFDRLIIIFDNLLTNSDSELAMQPNQNMISGDGHDIIEESMYR